MNTPSRPVLLLFLSWLLILPLLADKLPADPLADYLGKLGYARVEVKRVVRRDPEYTGAGNYLYVDARVDGRKQKWLVDTGFSITCFDSSAGKRYKTLGELDRQIDDPVLGQIGGTNFVLINELQLGGMRLTNQPAQVRDFGNRYVLVEKDAILGLDLLRRHHAVIDFLGWGLFLRSAKPDEKTTRSLDETLRHSGWTVIPLITNEGLGNFVKPYIRAEPLRMVVDSGAQFTQLDLEVAKRLGLKRGYTGLTMRGVEGRSASSYSAPIPLLQLPGFALTNELVFATDLTSWQAKEGGPQIDGLFGADWLAAGESVLDCESGRLYLRPFHRSKK